MGRYHSFRTARKPAEFDISEKANRILHLMLIALILIVLRIWFLSVIQYEKRLEESLKPQKKSVIIPSTRATIRDRFNIPLAVNRISYQATIIYSEFKEVPLISWKMENGKKIKVFRRREYIQQLSQLLGRELSLDPQTIEDLIYSKASFYAHIPFIIKEEISETEYYKLKMLAREWPGIHMRKVPKRFYPKGRTAADIIGYMGAINKNEYENILREIKDLSELIQKIEQGDEDILYSNKELEEAKQRLKELKEKAYSLQDHIGKSGIELMLEKELRGFYGKSNHYLDSKGNFLWPLSGNQAPVEGDRVILTLSAELQEYAEQLLAQNEEFRLVRKSLLGENKKTVVAQKSPWIKGGAIVVMEPNSGEVLALASYPRFDPNDFISSNRSDLQKEKNRKINRWFENEHYLAQIWNLQRPLERERFDSHKQKFYEEGQLLLWPNYLNLVLLENSDIYEAMQQVETVQDAISIQLAAEKLCAIFSTQDLYSIFNYLYQKDEHIPHSSSSISLKASQIFTKFEAEITTNLQILNHYFQTLKYNYDKVLIVDLCQIAANPHLFKIDLLQAINPLSIKDHRKNEGALVSLISSLQEALKICFHTQEFIPWRKEHGKDYLKQKRLEERKKKSYAKPYIDYFQQLEKEQFNAFWSQYQWQIIEYFLLQETIDFTLVSSSIFQYLTPYFTFLNEYFEKNPEKLHQNNIPFLSDLAQHIKSLPRDQVVPYLQTLRAYQDLTRPLYGRYKGIRSPNCEKSLSLAFYPLYGYGYARSHAYRQAAIQGSLFKIVTAYEALVQRYKKIEENQDLSLALNPLTILEQEYYSQNKRFLGYTHDGKAIPQLYKNGRLPRSLAHRNIGKIDLIKALEFSSNPYFSLLASDHIQSPHDLVETAKQFGYGAKTGIFLPGEISGRVPDDVEENRTGLYTFAIGQHSLVVTPLQTAVMLSAIANGGKVLTPKIVRLIAGKKNFNKEATLVKKKDSLSLVKRPKIEAVPTEIKRELFYPFQIQRMILKGLQASFQRTCQENLNSLQKFYHYDPQAIQALKSLNHCLLGKTSTSESVERIDLDLQEGANMYTHVWFGAISADSKANESHKSQFIFRDEFGKPTLVVVVYLRYGGYGKEAAPLAAQIVKKWESIKQQHALNY